MPHLPAEHFLSLPSRVLFVLKHRIVAVELKMKLTFFSSSLPYICLLKSTYAFTGSALKPVNRLTRGQVYALLGKLDLLLKRREDVLGAYHREAEEGAREARALLASAAAQHSPDQAWGMSRPRNVRQLIGAREG